MTTPSLMDNRTDGSSVRPAMASVVAVVSQKGGVGKTTLAIHLAAAAIRTSQVSLVIDTDPQASASRWAVSTAE